MDLPFHQINAWFRGLHQTRGGSYCRQLLLQDRLDDALAALRETSLHARRFSRADAGARYLLFTALGKAGRYNELERHVAQDLRLFAWLARVSVADRRRYVSLLAALVQFWSTAGRPRHSQDADTLLRAQRHILRRQLARRRSLWRAVGVLVRHGCGDPARPPADTSADYGTRLANQAARLEAAVAAQVAEVQRHRQTGDTRALAGALARLARARWRTGGQRSAALAAQREALELTRHLARQDPARSAQLLVERLLCFAEWAETIGLHTDAQTARAEATALNNTRPPAHRGGT
jgi:hypothetical protein